MLFFLWGGGGGGGGGSIASTNLHPTSSDWVWIFESLRRFLFENVFVKKKKNE